MAESSFDILNQILGGTKEHSDFVTNAKVASLKQAAEMVGASDARMKAWAAGANSTANPNATGAGQAFDMFLKAIAQQESGGNYGAKGSWVDGDRAYGKYQVMGNNIPTWTKTALGTSMTPQQFLHDKNAQDAVARHYLGNYFRQYGPRQAAMAWNQGVAGMEQGWGTDYAKEVMGRMRDYGYTKGMSQNTGNGGRPAPGGGWVSPIAGMNPTSNYGWRINPVSGERSFHEGIDWAAPAGAKLRAAHGGTIVESGRDPIYGKNVVIETPRGKQILYGHLSRINNRFDVGESINAGQRVGKVGSTGWSTGPHLHWGVYNKQGESLDPMRFVRKFGQPGNQPHNQPNQGHSQGGGYKYTPPPQGNAADKFSAILRDLAL